MLNILLPMAGLGSRFHTAGYEMPKPLIPVHGKPMIQVVIENLRPAQPHRFIFVCQREHLEMSDLRAILNCAGDDSLVIPIDYVTEGAACTVLLAEAAINSDVPLMIANCDQYIACSIDDYLEAMTSGNYDGFIMTMTANDPKWSFTRINESGKITEVVEKVVVSTEATVGIYNYKTGRSFVESAKKMISLDDRTNNEFYVAPAYNYMISDGMNIGYMNIGFDRAGMYGLGVPDDLEYFNALPALPAAQ